MKNVYGYIRVSDQKQIDGASLSEQERIIKEYAVKNNLNILEWFKETRTAAKKGRPQFTKMMDLLQKGNAGGVVIHKIDRSARNLHDWASVGDLIDKGIEVHFAHESLDMTERGGRLSADIQAVMASDYVRNLRQEALKGLYGRLKQGIYPFRAPIGYTNTGKGAVKTINEKESKLIVMLFELYVHENHSIRSLVQIMKNNGLRNWRGNPLSKTSISRIINNPFYMGLMKVKGKIFEGSHEPIISPRLYKQAQIKINGRIKSTNSFRHNYLFRGLMNCHLCSRSMIGELQKGMVYYRCHQKDCPTKTRREDFVEQSVINFLKHIKLTDDEHRIFKNILNEHVQNKEQSKEILLKGLNLQLNDISLKEQKLVDAYLENLIDKEELNERKKNYKEQIWDLKYRKDRIENENNEMLKILTEALELCKLPINMYHSATREEKRMMLKMMVSNFAVNEKRVMILPLSPYSYILNRDKLTLCTRNPALSRTLSQHIIYSHKNTSPILPKPLNSSEIKSLFKLLIKKNSKAHADNSLIRVDHSP
ncbi:MAG: recombinase family protein [Patiriisocius sp.]|uniref:recombinase family protein n=1 Tax=Patiriisocius sp. TaxID=2822396 RepID=UPI003EF58658